MPSAELSIGEARRIALAAQGFDRPRPSRRVDEGHLHRLVRRLGLIQIDSVNVLVPAHYQVPFSRLGHYDRAKLDALIYRRRVLAEQWAHEASIVPVETWPLLRYRTAATDRRARALGAFLASQAALAESVLNEIRSRGPVTASDVTDPLAPKPKRDWWGWSNTKATLEGHFALGTLAIAERRADFARLYDLSERVIPAEHHGRSVPREEAQRELLRLSARSHGIGTADDLADYYRIPIREARPRLAELVDAGELREVRVEGWKEVAYLHPSARTPRRIDAAALLSPFDPVVWYRRRAERLFDFDYRIEIYVPKPKRRWGYYVLPFLLGDRLVARVDLKADRQAGRLAVQAAYVEPHTTADNVAPRLAEELRTMARWLGLGDVVVTRKGNLAGSLRGSLGHPERSEGPPYGHGGPSLRSG